MFAESRCGGASRAAKWLPHTTVGGLACIAAVLHIHATGLFVITRILKSVVEKSFKENYTDSERVRGEEVARQLPIAKGWLHPCPHGVCTAQPRGI